MYGKKELVVVDFRNEKLQNSIIIYVTYETKLAGTQEFSYEYSKGYLESINFDLDTCKKPFNNFIKERCKGIKSKSRCDIVNHVAASINDFKRYINEQKTNIVQ